MVTKPGCEGCALQKIGSGFTEVEIGARFDRTRLMIVGEASGEAEAREGLPFRPYAQSGSLLAQTMREVGVSRADVAITNVLRCRPPKDWLEGAPYQYNAISNCTTRYLTEVIRELDPAVILTLGGTAFRALTEGIKGRSGTLDYIRGYAVRGAGAAEGRVVVPTYHPAFLRRGASHLTPLLQRDLRRAFLIATGKLAGVVDPMTLGLEYQTTPNLAQAWDYAKSLDDSTIAFDIETPMSTREDEDERTSFTNRDIKLIQFCQKRGKGIALPWRDEFKEVAKYILSLPVDKVGFNCWSFDLPVLNANDALVAGVVDDAMVMFHSAQPDLPANLQSVAQYCGWAWPWKHLSEVDLGFYGVADVDATLHVFYTMKAIMERE